MPDRPLLLFPQPAGVKQPKRSGGFRNIPSFDVGQAERLSNTFESIVAVIQSVPGDVEKVLVLETIGQMEDFHKAVDGIDGLEWLAEFDLDEVEADWDVLYPNRPDDAKDAKKAGGRLYLASSNREAIKRLLRFWNRWKSGETLEHGYGRWGKMFSCLHEMRFWGYQDMVRESGFIEAYKEDIAREETADGKTTLDFEVEFHFRQSREYESEFIQKIERIGGSINGEFVYIPEAGFHAVKVTVPIAEMQLLLSLMEDPSNRGENSYFLNPDRVKYCRPMAIVTQEYDDTQESEEIEFPQCNGALSPVVAVLDGVPMLNHEYLKDRMVFDDPDEYSSRYQGNAEKKHGTSMASLICHDDLRSEGRKTLIRPIYIRPVMVQGEDREEFLPGQFPEDITFRAVRRMFEQSGDEQPVASGVKVINLSLGNTMQVFINEMSPWARVLDYLSWRYKVLFVVSAGNAGEKFEGLDGNDLATSALQFINREYRDWRIVSPAESLNALTVGSVNEDGAEYDPPPTDNVDLFAGTAGNVVAAYSRLGSGYRGQIKPEIIISGGKMHYKQSPLGDNWHMQPNYPYQGLQHAFPDPSGGEGVEVNTARATSGTSNSAAVTTHAAGLLYEVLEEIREGQFSEQYDALFIKALLVHSASREGMSDIYENTLKNPQNSKTWKAYLSKFSGYGVPDFDRVKECTGNRVVILGHGDIEERKRQKFTLPIPAQCKQSSYIKLYVTLAWFSPITIANQYYRRSKLHFTLEGVKNIKRQHDSRQVKKGTIQHEVFTFTARALNEEIALLVDCYANTGSSLGAPSIPYALAVTMEVSEGIDIYDEIKTAISQQVPVDPSV